MNKQKHPDPLLISYLSLRKAVGMLGLFLPAVLLAGTYILGHCNQVQYSISHYYYTIMGDVFSGMLCTVAVFLLCYTGYDWIDRLASNLAGVFALLVALIPTSANEDIYCSIRHLADNDQRVMLHYTAAALFFMALAYLSLFRFTKSDDGKTPQKIARNRVYIICGITILAAILCIFILQKLTGIPAWLSVYKPIFCLEWLALAAFGISWLTKGELLLKDKPGASRLHH